MKNIIFSLLMVTAFAGNSQCLFPEPAYYDLGPIYKAPEYYVPILTIGATFATNYHIIRTPSFAEMSPRQQQNITLTTYGIGVIVTIGSHYGIKYLKENRPIKRLIKRRRFKRR